MEVQCYAWVHFEGDNTTQIVNIEEVTTFDVGIRKLTESSVIFHVSIGVPMIDRFCVVFRVLLAFDVKLRNLNYSLFKAYSLTISTNTKK